MKAQFLSNDRLQRKADDLASRLALGTTTASDSLIVIELANRLIRAQHTTPASAPVSPIPSFLTKEAA